MQNTWEMIRLIAGHTSSSKLNMRRVASTAQYEIVPPNEGFFGRRVLHVSGELHPTGKNRSPQLEKSLPCCGKLNKRSSPAVYPDLPVAAVALHAELKPGGE